MPLCSVFCKIKAVDEARLVTSQLMASMGSWWRSATRDEHGWCCSSTCCKFELSRRMLKVYTAAFAVMVSVWALHVHKLLELSRVVPDFYTILTYFTRVSSSYWHAFRLHVLIYRTLFHFSYLVLVITSTVYTEKSSLNWKNKFSAAFSVTLVFPFLPFMVQFLLPEIEETDTGIYKCYSHRHVTCTCMHLLLTVEYNTLNISHWVLKLLLYA